MTPARWRTLAYVSGLAAALGAVCVIRLLLVARTTDVAEAGVDVTYIGAVLVARR